ncbi:MULTISPECIES: hypothetical protein [unclassified Yoonia]|uniref:hypothetical protein n=1 Tax=unclassified Yoonia TaxID=2629118 RepID=UPI002B0027A6|nr:MULTISPECIES: hypothetical protein [unclassified Yoonia]
MFGIMTFRSAAVVLALAIGAGYVVQSDLIGTSAGPTAPLPASISAQPRSLSLVLNTQGTPAFGFPDDTFRPARHDLTTMSTVPVPAVYVEAAVPRLGTIMATPDSACPVALSARRAADAMVTLTATLPCAPDTDVLIAHDLIRFSARTDSEGLLETLVPALSVEAEFVLFTANVEQARVTIPVPALRNYDRAVLQWRGAGNLQLHSFAAGAEVGDPGHVWSASVQDTIGSRGTVQRLGTGSADPSYSAEVFTYPQGGWQGATDMALKIGVVLTAENCGRAMPVTTFQINRGDLVMRRDMSLRLPGCDGAGSVVLLDDRFTPPMPALR